MMQRDPAEPHIASLLAGMESSHYTLPAGVVAAGRVLEDVRGYAEELRRTAPPLSAAELAESLGDELIDVVAKGERGVPAAFLDRIEAAEREHRRLTYGITISSAAEERAWHRLLGAVASTAEETISGHLRPALKSTLAIVGAAAPKLAGIDVTDAEGIVGASKPVQDAYGALRAASGRYSAIRAAQRHLYAVAGGPQSGELFTEIENLRELWGVSWRGRRQTQWRPDPEHPLRRLMWLVTSDARPWVPTADEADAAYEVVRAEFAPRNPKTALGVFGG